MKSTIQIFTRLIPIKFFYLNSMLNTDNMGVSFKINLMDKETKGVLYGKAEPSDSSSCW